MVWWCEGGYEVWCDGSVHEETEVLHQQLCGTFLENLHLSPSKQ